MTNWISVEDELPESGKEVLVFRDYGDRKIIEVECWSNKFSILNCATHWMPLPSPPLK